MGDWYTAYNTIRTTVAKTNKDTVAYAYTGSELVVTDWLAMENLRTTLGLQSETFTTGGTPRNLNRYLATDGIVRFWWTYDTNNESYISPTPLYRKYGLLVRCIRAE